MSKKHKVTSASSPQRKPMDDEIRSLAYQLHCEGGYQDGRDLEHWLEAEQQLLTHGKAHLRSVD
jgi:hypothetical protein